MEELVLLGKTSNRMEAEVIKSYLEDNGIFVFLKSSTVPYGDGPYMGIGGPVEVWIPESSIKVAIELVEKKKEEEGGGFQIDPAER
ncbi:MAG TPA: DUF2007 domain-containing protein [bacterium]|jgi:hypothetical protein|nr:DUF2007 domain-containing protein [Dictyoglomota bacterium]HHV82014.1 DUF2007 domain-containing protein [bacterium]HOK29377.1 DUF2007 domain-containing protein [bacterium]HOL54761.1 DUF2007 domain-containing protein [bacterium]HOP55402.1 DUF2007 domain-containing protein [bacterium]